jgi:O-acetyl-ADP-ribose deacetylase (regulator of RNase III)
MLSHVVGAARMKGLVDGRMQIVLADITTLEVDVIVNAANAALCGGGGVDGAIHDAAGPELLAACRLLGSAQPGEVKLTEGYRLPARMIAHAVGPVWSGGDRNEDVLLASCYSNALALAAEHGLRSIAFPSISTGAFRFPIERAARIALTTVRDGLAQHADIRRAVFCCYDAADLRIYKKVAARVLGVDASAAANAATRPGVDGEKP